MIQKQFITYNLKIEGNTRYPNHLIEVDLFPIESVTMFRYLSYNKKLHNMESKRLPKFASNFSQNPHLCLKQGQHQDAQSWLKLWGIKEEIIVGSKDSIKDNITSSFKDKMWDAKELEGKRKLSYCKEVINPTLNNQNYLSVLTSTKKKMNISRIRTNSHELRSETEWWSTPKTPWDDRICQICDTKKVEDETHFPVDCLNLTHIHFQFPIISHTSNLLDLLS